jgi:hypothetical protein
MAGDLLRPGHGGKPVGRRSRLTLTLQEITERLLTKGTLPLEQMLILMRRPQVGKRLDETEREFADREYRDLSLRLEAAKAAAPYIHPKIATTINLDGGENVGANAGSTDIRELARDLAFALELAARQQPIDVTPTASEVH